MGGLVGAIVVDSAVDMPDAFTAMTPHLLVLTHISMCSCNPTTDPFRIISYFDLR